MAKFKKTVFCKNINRFRIKSFKNETGSTYRRFWLPTKINNRSNKSPGRNRLKLLFCLIFAAKFFSSKLFKNRILMSFMHILTVSKLTFGENWFSFDYSLFWSQKMRFPAIFGDFFISKLVLIADCGRRDHFYAILFMEYGKTSIKTSHFVFELVTMENFPNSVSKRFFRETKNFLLALKTFLNIF